MSDFDDLDTDYGSDYNRNAFNYTAAEKKNAPIDAGLATTESSYYYNDGAVRNINIYKMNDSN